MFTNVNSIYYRKIYNCNQLAELFGRKFQQLSNTITKVDTNFIYCLHLYSYIMLYELIVEYI